MSEFEKLVGRLDLCLYEKQIHSHGGGKWYSRNSCKYLSAEEVSDEIMRDVYLLTKSGDVLGERIAELEAQNTSLTADLAASRRREEAAVKDLTFACGSQPSASDDASICDICIHQRKDGSCDRQCFMNSIGGALNRWEWRGVAEKKEDAE